MSPVASVALATLADCSLLFPHLALIAIIIVVTDIVTQWARCFRNLLLLMFIIISSQPLAYFILYYIRDCAHVCARVPTLATLFLVTVSPTDHVCVRVPVSTYATLFLRDCFFDRPRCCVPVLSIGHTAAICVS